MTNGGHMYQLDQAAIAKSHELAQQIEALTEQLDKLMEPVYQNAIANAEYEDLKNLLLAMPPCSHRAKLRMYINEL